MRVTYYKPSNYCTQISSHLYFCIPPGFLIVDNFQWLPTVQSHYAVIYVKRIHVDQHPQLPSSPFPLILCKLLLQVSALQLGKGRVHHAARLYAVTFTRIFPCHVNIRIERKHSSSFYVFCTYLLDPFLQIFSTEIYGSSHVSTVMHKLLKHLSFC